MYTKNKFRSQQIDKKFKERQRIRRKKSRRYRKCKIKKAVCIRKGDLDTISCQMADSDPLDDIYMIPTYYDKNNSHEFNEFNDYRHFQKRKYNYTLQDGQLLTEFTYPMTILIECMKSNDIINDKTFSFCHRHQYSESVYHVNNMKIRININGNNIKYNNNGLNFSCNIESFDKYKNYSDISSNVMISDKLLLNHRIWGMNPSYSDVYSHIDTRFYDNKPHFFTQNNVKTILMNRLHKYNTACANNRYNDINYDENRMSVKEIGKIILQYLYDDNGNGNNNSVCWMELQGDIKLSCYLLMKLNEYYKNAVNNVNSDNYYAKIPWPIYIESNDWCFFDNKNDRINSIRFPSKRKNYKDNYTNRKRDYHYSKFFCLF